MNRAQLRRLIKGLCFRLFRKRMRWLSCLGPFDPTRYLMVAHDPLPIMHLPRPHLKAKACYFISPHKCGSMLLSDISKTLAAHNKIPYLDMAEHLFLIGYNRTLPFENRESLCQLDGYAHGVFRTAEYINTVPEGAKAVILIRDPRDAIISKYYSDAIAHRLPGTSYSDYNRNLYATQRAQLASMDIEQAVMEYVGFYKTQFAAIAALVDRQATGNHIRLYRYEDIIFNKREWIQDMTAFLGWHISKSQLSRLLSKVDIIPEKENAHRHVRQVAPGNYKRKLSEEAQLRLTRALSDILTRYGYQ